MRREEYRQVREAEARRIRVLILDNVAQHPVRLAAYLQDAFGVYRVFVYQELRKMVSEGILAVEGKTYNRRYALLKAPEEKPGRLAPAERERLTWKNRRRR